MGHRDLVVIGASAGGVEAIQTLLAGLPADFDAAVLIVLHTSKHIGSMLPQVFERAGILPALHPIDGTEIVNGHVYIAPPNFHMLVDGTKLRIVQGPYENLHRPAIDPLFRSAALFYGRRVIGVVLTGLLDDGTSGLMFIRARGGEAIVQDPATAMFSSMPQSALEHVPDARVAHIHEISRLVVDMVGQEVPEEGWGEPTTSTAMQELKFTELDMAQIENDKEHPGRPSAFACPDCGGVLWELDERGFSRFRCRVGHAYTARNLDAKQHHVIESALWSALRALEESAALYRRMSDRATDSRHLETAQQYGERASGTESKARVLREFLLHLEQEVPA